ncbi:hypothetical protein EYF80_038278 [Liparis tanakae]|uniref:Uncharacterized protein n=1 Tax=Liparis tanakae TaxID=230148 RepID=A0A4Z2GD90_9TELE|nr:hypothetical protein EYF80_038278 [Liparis tanakae]
MQRSAKRLTSVNWRLRRASSASSRASARITSSAVEKIRVVVDAVVDEQHALAVAGVLPEAVHAHRLRVHHADLALVELGQDGHLDGAAPGVVAADPGAVVLVGLSQHRFGVRRRVARHDLGDEASHLGGAGQVVHAALHHVVHAGEEAGVVRRHHSAGQRGRGVQARGFGHGGMILRRLWLVLFFLDDEGVSWRERDDTEVLMVITIRRPVHSLGMQSKVKQRNGDGHDHNVWPAFPKMWF